MWIFALFLLSTTWAQYDPTCVDKLTNCELYTGDGCKGQYEQWARTNCNNTCGYCIGPTKPPTPCEDTLKDCTLYPKSTCTDPMFQQWAEHRCRYFCRKCTPLQLQIKDAQITTLPPSMCKDKLNNCELYPKSSCTGNYTVWARENCMATCGFCVGAPTSSVCADKVDCSRYEKDICTSTHYVLWARANCAKFCNVCTGGTGPAIPVTSGGGLVTPPISHGFPTPPPPGR